MSDPKTLAHALIEALVANLADLRELGPLNENKELNPTFLQNLAAQKFQTKKITPQAAFFMAGAYTKNNRMTAVFKTYLGLVAEKWGFSLQDALKCLSVYIIFSGYKSQELTATGLSRALVMFITGEPSRALKPITSVGIYFIHTFVTVMTTQVIEINRKYKAAPPDQQEKLVKLYSAPERRGMIVGNAATYAFQRISSYKSESIEISKIFKTFAKKMPVVIAPDDLFGPNYNELPI